AALSVGRRGAIRQRWEERNTLKTGVVDVPLEMEFDREKMTRRVKELTSKVTREPQNATFKINPDESVSVVPAVNGTAVDMDRLIADITSLVSSGKNGEVLLSLVKVKPERSTAMMQSTGVNGLLGSFTTYFDPSKAGRSYNVGVAARALDELLVMPDQEVSFNEVVGPRSSEAGYKTAPVIVNNEFVDGIGGGVCQVSTTLYNSVLLANLDIVERVSHSLPVSYVPIGRDATVVYGAIDFRFHNNTYSYLYLKSDVGNGSLTIRIYGNTRFKRDVVVNSWVTEEIEPKVVYESDQNLPKGEQVVKQEGAKGYRVSAVRVVMKDGVVEKREPLPSSEYSPVNKLIAVGTGEAVRPRVAPAGAGAGTPASPAAPDGPGQTIDPTGGGNRAIPGIRPNS
ncbi:MAG: VanW family protein, partial [Firmicutes bacterium]|nr:VanW family protein [Bacillota bacterium]